MCKEELKECEVVIKIKIPKEKMSSLYAAIEALNEIGVTFDTGGCVDKEGILHYDMEFDWSLKGAKVYFKKFKEAE